MHVRHVSEAKMNNNWSLLSTRERVCILYQVESNGAMTPGLWRFSLERMNHFRQLVRQTPNPFQNNVYRNKLRVCCTWFTLYSLLLEPNFPVEDLFNILESSVFSVALEEEVEVELMGVLGDLDLYGLPVASIQQCLTKKTEDVLLHFIPLSEQ